MSLEKYYQLAVPIDKPETVLSALSMQKIQSTQLKVANVPLLAVRITTANLSDFDKKMNSLHVRYFLIRNLNFKLLLKNSKKLNIRLRKIDVGALEDQLKEEYDEAYEKALTSRDYTSLVDVIEKNELIIKKLEVSYSGLILTIYENGMVWVSEDLIASDETKTLLTNVLSVFK